MLLGGVLLLYFIDGLLARLRFIARPDSATPRGARGAASSLGARAAIALGVQRRVARGLLASRVSASVARGEFARERARAELRRLGGNGPDERLDVLRDGGLRSGREPPVHARSRRSRGVHRPGRRSIVARAAISRRRPAIRAAAGSPSASEPARIAGREATMRVLRKGATRLLAVSWFEASPGLAVESARALLALDSTALLDRKRVPLAVRLTTPLASAGDRAAEIELSAAGALRRAHLAGSAAPFDPTGILALLGKPFLNRAEKGTCVPSLRLVARLRIIH